MSVPRLGFTDNFFCATSIFPSLNIRLAKHSGAFWDQSISKLFYERVDAGDDYIITVDYDSIYSRQDVITLIEQMEATGADAIFATQIKRDSRNVLMALHPEEIGPGGAVDLNKPLTRAITGHFGLTIIRCESLRKLEHPWFYSHPNGECKWDAGKVDADIFFWNAVEHKAQWRVYQSNNVRIGHIQRVITWVTKDLKCVHQYIDDWEKNGMPSEVIGAVEVPTVTAEIAPTSREPESSLEAAGGLTPTGSPAVLDDAIVGGGVSC